MIGIHAKSQVQICQSVLEATAGSHQGRLPLQEAYHTLTNGWKVYAIHLFLLRRYQMDQATHRAHGVSFGSRNCHNDSH